MQSGFLPKNITISPIFSKRKRSIRHYSPIQWVKIPIILDFWQYHMSRYASNMLDIEVGGLRYVKLNCGGVGDMSCPRGDR